MLKTVKRIFAASLVFCLFLVILAVLPSESVIDKHYEVFITATVSISPANVTVDTGQTFNVTILIASVNDLCAWELRASWNPAIMYAIDATEGVFLKSGGGGTFFTYNINATEAAILLDCTLLGSAPGVSGEGTLATIHFNAENVGRCPLLLFNITLLNSLDQPFPNQGINGFVFIIGSNQGGGDCKRLLLQ